jgi:hypothetical protein
MNNDTISNQVNLQDADEEQTNYLGNKREADTELNKIDTGILII